MGINEFIKIGDKIKSLRISLKLTQEEMANKLSLPRSTYANYEGNKREPSSDVINKICEIFDISTQELIGEYEPNFINNSIHKTFNDILKYSTKPSELSTISEELSEYAKDWSTKKATLYEFIALITSEAWQTELGYTENDLSAAIINELFEFTLEMLNLKFTEIKYKNLINTNESDK